MMKLEKIVILGGGVTGCVVAASLINALANSGIAIIVIELAEDEAEKHEAITLSPYTQVFHEALGLDEAQVLAYTQGTFNLGTSFKGWSGTASHFLQTYAGYGVDFHGVEFQHFYNKFKDTQQLTDYHHYSLSAAAALSGKFCHPVSENKSILSTINYGLNVNGKLYSKFLKKYASARGVTFKSGDFLSASINQAGFVQNILLSCGTVSGDFFIDCSGSSAFLIEGALGIENVDWSGYFFNTHRATFVRPDPERIPSSTSVTALKNSWVQSLPLQGYSVNSMLFCEKYFDKNELDNIAQGTDMLLRPIAQGHRKKPWQSNVVAFGSAAGTVEPFIFSSTDVLYRNIQSFIKLLPTDILCSIGANEYNRTVVETYTRVRDYNLCHYLLSAGVSDSSYWNACREVPVSPSLEQRIALFKNRGKVIFHDSEMIPTAAWISLLMGFGVMPQNYDPRVDIVDAEGLRKKIQQMRLIIANAAEKMPYHGDYLRRYLRHVRK